MTVLRARCGGAIGVALCVVVALTACARWRSGGPRVAPATFTSFEDLLPDEITAIVYLPDLPRSKSRFRTTDLAERLGEQTTRGLWRRLDFLRPWVRVAFEQITDQVDELAWGTYRAGGREQWFLVARVNRPARHVLTRLHEETLPKVAEDLHPLTLTHARYRGRTIYAWASGEGAGARSLCSYALIGQVMVMASDGDFVRCAIESRPSGIWRWFHRGAHSAIRHPPSAIEASRSPVRNQEHRRAAGVPSGIQNPKSKIENLESSLGGCRRDDDFYLWSRVEPRSPSPAETPPSRLSQLTSRVQRIVAAQLVAVAVGVRLTPPTVIGRWRLELARPLSERPGGRKPFDFVSIVPASAQTFIGLHDLPFDQPLLSELRSLLRTAMVSEPFARLGDSLRLLGRLAGMGELGRVVASLEGKAAYCSFPSDDTSRPTRCLVVALENPAAVESGFLAVPLLLRKVVTKEEYRGRPVLVLGGKKSGADGGIAFGVVGGALAVAPRVETVRGLIDAVARGETLDRQTVVKQLQGLPRESILAEFYSAGSAGRVVSPEKEAEPAARTVLGDPRLRTLAAGRSYSLCLQQPRGLEIVTCSTTGFHWSSATLGLATIVLRAPVVAGLFR